jgi:hypothetical protein
VNNFYEISLSNTENFSTLPPRGTRKERGCVQSTSRNAAKVAADSGVFAHCRLTKPLRLVFDTAALRGSDEMRPK